MIAWEDHMAFLLIAQPIWMQLTQETLCVLQTTLTLV